MVRRVNIGMTFAMFFAILAVFAVKCDGAMCQRQSKYVLGFTGAPFFSTS